MRAHDKTIIFSVALIFITGFIVGQGFSFEVKLSDLIALSATIITFIFARNGLKHNEKQYLHSIQPVIEKMEYFDKNNLHYKFSIKNYGSGSALDLQYSISLGGKSLTQAELEREIYGTSNNLKFTLGGPLCMSSNDNVELLVVKAIHSKEIRRFMHLLPRLKLSLSYNSIQGEKFTKEFLFGQYK
ncbi:hypothetical protein WNY79_18435 [Pseudoalteromonas sp. AS84]|uniref:hypothetical protein n=1 Tax=Pseudoalteromonas sp. AS84 TaxID=3135778 RepID=UPI00317B6F74